MKKLFGLILAIAFTQNLWAQNEDLGDGLFADISTAKGHIILQLEFEKVPMTVASFVALAEGKLKYDTVRISEPFYNGVTFHRVIQNFMIQGGDPTGTGSGNPGYFFPDEIDTSLKHTGPGILSMANAGPNTNGSQFFITHKETPWLDGKHAVFGHVVKGRDVVDNIRTGDIIESITIIRNGKAAKKFKAHKIFPKMLKQRKKEEAERVLIRNLAFKSEMEPSYPDAEQTGSGLMYQITEEGDGENPVEGKKVTVHYTGYFTDGSKFDSSVDRGKPFEFVPGQRRVIMGWEEGVLLGQIGGKIKLIIPYWLAYGEAGRGKIPPKATLIFDIEIISQ